MPLPIGFLNTYPPTPCGLATFTASLRASSSRRAAAELDGFDVAIVQHESGSYGGLDGDDVLGVVDAVTVPVIVIRHTVLPRRPRGAATGTVVPR